MAETFADESKNIRFEPGQLVINLGYFLGSAVNASQNWKAENHSKEGPINTTVGKSGI